jgi:AcrR family transcriptional regulator
MTTEFSKNENAKVARSKQKLREAYLRLTTHRPANHITVSDLCREATVNRTTFYKYYKNTRQLADAIIADVMEHWHGIIDNFPIMQDPELTIEQCLQAIESDPLMVAVVFSNNDNGNTLMTQIPDLFYDQLIEFWRQRFGLDIKPTELKVAYHYVMSGVLGVVKRWSNGDIQCDTRELSKLIFKMGTFGIVALLDEHGPSKASLLAQKRHPQK